MAAVILETEVTKVGASAGDFAGEGMLIFFNETVPDYLADYCYLIRPCTGSFDIGIGDTIVIDQTRSRVTAIGDTALENLRALGHLVVRFDGKTQAALPGSIHVEQMGLPEIRTGMRVWFERE